MAQLDNIGARDACEERPGNAGRKPWVSPRVIPGDVSDIGFGTVGVNDHGPTASSISS